jgi:hypothetical protein
LKNPKPLNMCVQLRGSCVQLSVGRSEACFLSVATGFRENPRKFDPATS